MSTSGIGEPALQGASPLPTGLHAAWVRVLILVALSAVVVGVYWNTTDGPFVYDDVREVLKNASIRSPSDFGTVVRHNLTRPLANISYAYDYARSTKDPRAYHITNIALHALNVWLLFLVARGAGRDLSERLRDRANAPEVIAVTAAALFAVHPLMSSAVAYIGARAELLAATFFLCGMIAGREALLRPTLGWVVLTWIAWLLSLASKEVAVMLPAMLWVYDKWILRGAPASSRQRAIRLYIPMGAAIAVLGAVRLWLLLFIEYGSYEQSRLHSAVLEAEVLVKYLRLFAWPVGLSLVHHVPPLASLGSVRALLAVASLAVVGTTAISLRRSYPLAAFGLVWFLAVSLPSAALVLLIEKSEFLAEHRTYLPGCGIFLCAGVLAGTLWTQRARARTTLSLAFAVVVVLLATATVRRNEVWRHPLLIWGDAARKSPNAWLAHYGYGTALQNDGDCDRALEELQRALELRPGDAMTYARLAGCLIELQRPDEAAAAIAQASRAAPDAALTLEQTVRYAVAFGSRGQVGSACAQLRRVAPDTTLPECSR